MPRLSRKRIATLAIGAVVGLAVIAGASLWWTDRQRHEETDNAFVEADTVQVSPQVSGYVAEVLVADNQKVLPGQVLVRLDPATFQARVDQAVANADSLEAAIRAVDDRRDLEAAMVAQKAAGVASAQAMAAVNASDVDRYRTLSQRGWVSPQKIQTQQATADQSAAAVEQARAALVAEQRAAQSLGSARSQSVAQAAGARAAVAAARLDLDRTVIRAPIEGVVGARSVRPGQLVQPGMTLLAVVPLGQTYVVANFKETQLARLRLGQPVVIKADAFGGKTIKGRVQSFAPATGAEFALIPVENAVGNFTKVTQRVPVRIALESASPLAASLRPGLSVKVSVDVTQRTGPSFAESGAGGEQFARTGQSR